MERGWNAAFAVGFSPDGSRIAAPTLNGGVRLWDGTGGGFIRGYEKELSIDMVSTSFCFSPDGTRMAAGSRDNTIVVDARNGRVLAKLGSPRGPSEVFRILPASYVLKNDTLLIDDLEWRRRRPEWWWGHFYRPEVWVAFVLGVIWLWSVVKYLRRRLRERAGAA